MTAPATLPPAIPMTIAKPDIGDNLSTNKPAANDTSPANDIKPGIAPNPSKDITNASRTTADSCGCPRSADSGKDASIGSQIKKFINELINGLEKLLDKFGPDDQGKGKTAPKTPSTPSANSPQPDDATSVSQGSGQPDASNTSTGTGTGDTTAKSKTVASPDTKSTPNSNAAGFDNLVTQYASKLPENMPAVFDLQVGSSGKTLRQITEETAEKTGTPAILLAGQAWQETKAGLYGKDPKFVEQYAKPKSGGNAEGSLDSTVTTTTGNPGNGLGDSGILQINPLTFQTLVDGKDNLGGKGDLMFTPKAHPELAGLNPTNIEDAFMIAGTLNKDMQSFYQEKDFAQQGEDAWKYTLRAYVGGPGAVTPGNPYVNAAGGGDVTYVDKVTDHMEDFANGVPPRWPA